MGGWIWVFIDQYGDIETEFFYPEVEEGVMPYPMEKASWERPYSEPTRLKIYEIRN